MNDPSKTDQELVAQCRVEFPYQTRAFELLIHRYQDKVMGKVVGMLKNREDARDVCQDVFVKVFQGLGSFQGQSSFSTWLYAVTVNTCLNHIEKTKLRPWRWLAEDVDAVRQDDWLDMDVRSTIGQRLENDALQQQIDDVLQNLNEGDRDILKMRFIDELDYQTIADQLGVGLSAVKMRIKRAREHFKTDFERARKIDDE